jgi:ADP-ribosyl-[dinitrogen reductase] hydrolase
MSDISRSVIKMVREAQADLAVKVSHDDQSHEVSFIDAVLQASWAYEAAHDPGIKIEPATSVCRLFGLACSIGFMLPAAYYLVSRFENDFYTSVMTALNGGGNNMARASLTGALAGAQVGISGIPANLIEGLNDHDHLMDMVKRVVES